MRIPTCQLIRGHTSSPVQAYVKNNTSRFVSQSSNKAKADEGPAALTTCNWNNYKTSCQY